MTIRFVCGCGKKLKAPDEKIGRKVLCPECGSPVVVAEPVAARAEAVAADAHSPSNAAGDLLKRTFASKKHTQPETAEVEEISPAEQHEARERAELRRQIFRVLLPGLAALVLVSLGVYWLSWMMFVGGVEHPPLKKVSGVVTLDGEPLEGATVDFLPFEIDGQSPGGNVSSSSGITDEDGRYTLMYVEGVKGAAVGRHKVSITKMDGSTGRQILAPQYNAGTTLEIEVPSDKYDFELTSR